MKIQYIDYGLDKDLFPKKNYEYDAGVDIFLNNKLNIKAHSTVCAPLGFGVKVPAGSMLQIIERSSIAKLGFITHQSPIDADYTGEIHLIITNLTNNNMTFSKGQKIAQLVMTPITYFEIIEDNFERRNTNGLGSSGK